MALNKQIWIGQIMQGFYPSDDFLSKVTDFSQFVEYDALHIASAGVDPKVLVNNSTYPIKVVGREDADQFIQLDKFETENTIVRRPDAIEYSYDKLESVIRQHRSTLRTSVASKAIHAYAPTTNTADTPLIMTSGATVNGRKRMTFEDLLKLKEMFDEALIPLENRYIVLHPKHVTDLLLEDLKMFKDLTEIKDGEPRKFAGFGVYQFPYMPTYQIDGENANKVGFDAEKTANFASVAFCSTEVMKSDGDIYMYSREDDPEERGTIVGFDKRFIALPIRGKGVGAIISATA